MFVSFLRDISDEVAAEKALMAARDDALAGERTKAEFMAVMSHEMRTPLNGLLGTLELLDDTSLDQKQRELLSVATTSGKLLLHHVSDVLEISKLDADVEKPAHTPFDVPGLINGVCGSQRSIVTARNIDLKITDMNLGNTLVMGDEMRLTQILLNILGNALKFAPGGQVSIECERLGGTETVEFRVADTGIGIADEDQDLIFDDFVTLDPSYGRAVSGTGLGLGITKRLVHVLGGEIGVESEAGEGSLFWFRIPLPRVDNQADHMALEAAQHPLETHVPNMRILIVEDNAINRLVVGEMLQGDGHQVTQACNGEEGISLAGQERFDLILMDISMPRMDGVQATQQIRALGGAAGRVPIVALTANALPEDVVRFKEAGMRDVLVKPVSRDNLRRLLGMVARGQTGVDVTSRGQQTDVVFNQQTLNELRSALSEDILRKLMSELERDGEDLLGPSAPKDFHDVTELAKSVHKLAGSAAVLGAHKLQSDLVLYEQSLNVGGPDDWQASRANIEKTWRITRKELTKLATS